MPYRDWLRIARELVLTIESLHAAGVVHGSLKPSNVIIDQVEARLRVTHVSPLLHDDPQKDTDAIVQMMLPGTGREKGPRVAARCRTGPGEGAAFVAAAAQQPARDRARARASGDQARRIPPA